MSGVTVSTGAEARSFFETVFAALKGPLFHGGANFRECSNRHSNWGSLDVG